jgi:ADP-ribosylglycohydrolase
MSQWTTPYLLLTEELRQRRDEGCDIPADLWDRYQRLDADGDGWQEWAIWSLYDELDELEPDAALAAREPDELAEIRALRPDGPRDLGWAPSEAELLDRLHGAWTGRGVGNALGKPVEHLALGARPFGLTGRSVLKDLLTRQGDWPLEDYISGLNKGHGQEIRWPHSQREYIAYVEPDDDIHYTLTGLGVLEEYGPSFRWVDVAQYWLSHIPVHYICTAEAQALMNLMTHSARLTPHGRGVNAGPSNLNCDAEFTRRYRNPYREWIGAQIRVDAYAWACAGNPELAAELAWRDAQWTHVRNGIYGAMFMAAVQAAAFVVHDVEQLVAIGLSEIPADCRLAQVLRHTLELCGDAPDFEAAMDVLEVHCFEVGHGTMSPVHTILNAAICVVALWFGELDSHRSITTSVMCGADTDCNGASVGSIVGAVAGRSGFDERLAGPVHDTIRPAMVGFAEVTMTELARRSASTWYQVREQVDPRTG